MSRRTYRWDKETRKMVEVYRDTAAYYHTVITDEMPATKHPKTGEIITSNRKWQEATRRSGCIEYDGEIKPKRISEEELARDVDQAMEKAIYAADNGQSVLSREAREYYREMDRRLSEVHGVDLTNIFKANRR